ncbi:NACHT domain-containing protein [Actinocorallia populi]|uniref:NACHT domain-containing protein n=1 Tax=Actinocorallia populi TaxID=2079200 RepID=UPI000D09750F|nr:NACHT domain-containing protein [Actinocorallia populi]
MKRSSRTLRAAPPPVPALSDRPPAAYPDPPGRAPLAAFLAPGRTLVVSGEPGSGKSTLLRRQALAMSRERPLPWRFRRLPLLLSLRDRAAALLDENPPDLAELAAEHLPLRRLRRRLRWGRCTVFLDGLDEIADVQQRLRIVSWIRAQTESHPELTFVVSARPHDRAVEFLFGAQKLHLQRLTPTQITDFLRRRHSAEELPELLRKQPALYDCATNPMLLTWIAFVYQSQGRLPSTRHDLYDEFYALLLERTDGHSGLTIEEKDLLTRRLALHMTRIRTYDISPADAESQLRGDAPAPQVFLEELRESGLLVRREHGYAFVHFSLQEHLAPAPEHVDHDPAAVLAAENLQETVWLDDTTALCVRPVMVALYRLSADRAISLDRPDRTAMTGVQAADAVRFVTWLNGLFEDGTSYRLPTPAEAAHPAFTQVPETADHTFWTEHQGELRLHRPGPVPSPYSPTSAQLVRYPSAFLEQSHRLLGSPSPATTRRFARTLDLLLSVSLFFDLARAHELSLSRLHALEHDLTHDFAMKIVPGAVHDLTGTLAREQAHADTLVRTRSLLLAHARALAAALDLTGSPALAEALARADLPAPDPALARDRALDTARALVRALARDLRPDRPHDPDLALAHDFAATLDLDLDLAHAFDPALSLALRPAHDVGSTLHLTRTLSQALGLDLGDRHRDLLPALTTACSTLLSAWQDSGTSFEDFLRALLTPAPPPQEPVRALRNLLARLPTGEPALPLLLEHAHRLASEALSRGAPGEPRTLLVACACLLAARTLLSDPGLGTETAAVTGALIALALPGDGLPQNQVLLLIRDS